MKKLILSAAVALCAATASASIEDVRIYINPGHGAWCSECRHMGTVTHGAANYTDTAGFYESNTNLQKGFGMFYKLKEYGVKHNASSALDLTQNLVMSRNKSGDVHEGLYDRPLSEIAAEAELNNFDMFISIHSNATKEGSTTNFPLFLYRGTDAAEGNAGSKAMATACWPHWQKNPHMMWTHHQTSTNIRGDVSYMGASYSTTHSNGKTYTGYYGVLRQGVPGFLVEGFFHTYQPARHKAMNWDACRWEGEAYAKGVNDYFGFGKKDSYGTIYGVLRDAEQTFTHTYYTPNDTTLDRYLPINNATVTLKNSEGTVVSTYTTDDEYNGVFVFNKVTPGTYTIVYSHPDYKDLSETVTVTADETVFPTPQIYTSAEQIAVQGHFAYALSSSQNGDIYTLKFKSTGAFDNASIIFTNTSTGATQSMPTGAIVKGENSVTVDANTFGENALFSWSVAIDNPKSTATELIYSDNIAYMPGSYYANGGVAIDLDETSTNFGTIYTSTGYGKGIRAYSPDFSTKSDAILGSSFNSSNSSSPYRIATSNGKVYITDWSDAHGGVWVYDPKAGATVTNMFTGTNDGTGKITNGSTVTGGGTTGVSFIGEGTDRKMYAFCEDYPSGNAGNQLLRYDIGTSDTWTAAPSKAFTTMTASTLFANTNVEVLATANGIFASQTRYSGSNSTGTPAFAVMSTDGTVTFNSGTSLTTLNGCNSGAMALYNDNTFAIVNGDGNIQLYSLSWSGSTPSFTSLYTITLPGTTVINQLAFDHAGNLYAYSKQEGLLVYAIKNPARQTVTKATSTIQGKAQPSVRGHYAYALSTETSATNYTLSFKSTGAADNAHIVLIDTSDNTETKIGIGTVVEGDNTVVIDRSELAQDTKFRWAVEIENPSSPSVEQILADNSIYYNNGSYDCRGGVAIDKDPESDNFGTVYTSTGGSYGIQKFNPDLTKNGNAILGIGFGTNIHSPYRIEVNNGKLYISDHSAGHAGVWVYDPAAGESVTNMFVGTNDGNGQIVNGSTATGGQATTVTFTGEGADRKMYIFSQDVPTVNASNKLLRYDIGESDSWTSAPSAQFDAISAKMANANVEILATANGIFCSQTRYSNNNTTDVPAFAVMSTDGTITFNSGTLSSLNGCNGGGMAIFGDIFAIVNGDGNIDIFTLAWNGSTPSFTHKYMITIDGTTEINQMDFDIAGNLYVFSRQQGLLVYVVRTDARLTRSEAKSDQLLEYASSTGIDNIKSDTGTHAVYYNMQGVRMNNTDMKPGIYIKVQNGKATRVMIDR